MSQIIEELNLQNQINGTDVPRYAHYADSVSVTEGYVMGKPVAGLCGTVFIPSRDPKKFPVCPTCKEIAEALLIDSVE